MISRSRRGSPAILHLSPLTAYYCLAGTYGTLIGTVPLNLPRILSGTLVDATAAAMSAGIWVPIGPYGMPMRRRSISSIGGARIFGGNFLIGILVLILAGLQSDLRL